MGGGGACVGVFSILVVTDTRGMKCGLLGWLKRVGYTVLRYQLVYCISSTFKLVPANCVSDTQGDGVLCDRVKR